jgi:hypothetical protein
MRLVTNARAFFKLECNTVSAIAPGQATLAFRFTDHISVRFGTSTDVPERHDIKTYGQWS